MFDSGSLVKENLLRKLIVAFCLAIAIIIVASPSVLAASIQNGEKVFNANCSACHLGGNNVIITSKTLKKEALEKYGMNSLEAVKNQVSNGKNSMPAFRSRLNDEQISSVAAYVLHQAEVGW